MKKIIVGLVGLALAGMMWVVQAADVIAPQKGGVGVIKAERQMAPSTVAKKTDNIAGVKIDDRRISGDELAKVGDPAWKSVKANEGGGFWKSASTGSGAAEAVFLSGYILPTKYVVTTVDPNRVLGATSLQLLSASSFASAMTALSPPARMIVTSFAYANPMVIAYGEKNSSSHSSGTGIQMTAVSGYNYGGRQAFST